MEWVPPGQLHAFLFTHSNLKEWKLEMSMYLRFSFLKLKIGAYNKLGILQSFKLFPILYEDRNGSTEVVIVYPTALYNQKLLIWHK